MRARLSIAVALTALACAAPPPVAAPAEPVDWARYLPTFGTTAQTQPGRIPYCKRSSMRCVHNEIKRMKRLQRQLHCDHRAVFATTYLELTRQIRDEMKADHRFFRDSRYLYNEDALFANVYFNAIKFWKRGRPVSEAWRIAFETARDGEVNGGQDMLLGINAHVQNDMPYVLAALGLRTPSGESRKPDHDKANVILERGYERVVGAVADRYDPLISTTNASWNPVDNTAGLELVKRWREDVWRNAERLVAARTHEERRQVSDEIQRNAADWARGIAASQTPGDRARRDAYCRERLGP